MQRTRRIRFAFCLVITLLSTRYFFVWREYSRSKLGLNDKIRAISKVGMTKPSIDSIYATTRHKIHGTERVGSIERQGGRHARLAYNNDQLSYLAGVAERVQVGGLTMLSLERLHNAAEAIVYVDQNGLAGDVVEVGVWRGGGSIVMRAAVLTGLGQRNSWLFDSFAGLPKDDDPRDAAIDARLPVQYRMDPAGSYADTGGVEGVRRNFVRQLGDDLKGIHFVPGLYVDTLPTAAVERIAVLRLDGDRYSSTMEILTHLYPKVSPGGVVIIDDYGWWPQNREAVHHYFESIGLDVTALLQRVDCTGRYFIKPGGCVDRGECELDDHSWPTLDPTLAAASGAGRRETDSVAVDLAEDCRREASQGKKEDTSSESAVGDRVVDSRLEPLPLSRIRPRDVSIVRYHVPDGGHSVTGRLTEINHAAYARRQGYRLGADEILEATFESIVHLVEPSSWIKVPLLLAAIDPPSSLEVTPSELVMWVDADTVFTNPEMELTSLLASLMPEGSAKSVIAARDLGDNVVNGGVLIVRRCEWSVAFLKRLLDSSRNEATRRSGYWEQDAIKVMWHANEYGEQDNIFIVEERHRINAFSKRREWRHGDFIAHHTQCPWHESFELSDDDCNRLFRLLICANTPMDNSLLQDYCAPVTGAELPLVQLNLLLESATNAAWPWPQGQIMGNIFDVPAEVVFYSKAAQLPGVQRLCEVGFAKGHSAIAMLWSNSESTLLSFDLEDLDYSQRSLEYVERMFPDRVTRVSGDSLDTLAARVVQQQQGALEDLCDLFSIDGKHEGEHPKLDFQHALKLTRKGGYLVADDVSPRSFPDVVAAWETLVTTEQITDARCEEHSEMIEGYQKRWCIGTVV